MSKIFIRFIFIFLTSTLGYYTAAFSSDGPDIIAISTIDNKGQVFPSNGPLFMTNKSIAKTLYSELSTLPASDIPCAAADTLLDMYQLQFFQKGRSLKTITITGCGNVYIGHEMHRLTSEFSDSMEAMQENGVFTPNTPPNSAKMTSLKFYFKGYVDKKVSYSKPRTIEDKASATHLYNAIISLPIWPYIPGIMHCPPDNGSMLHIDFLQGATVVQQVDVSLSGCKIIPLDKGHATRVTSSSFIQEADQILGTQIEQYR